MPIDQWYISAAAVREYMAIAGYPPDENGFDRAAKELSAVCAKARLRKDEGHRQLWIVRWPVLKGKSARLELTVSLQQRPEGPLPQLVRVQRRNQ